MLESLSLQVIGNITSGNAMFVLHVRRPGAPDGGPDAGRVLLTGHFGAGASD